MFTFNFEKLDVWQEAIQLASLVYKITRNFPEHERFGLTNQMRRAAVSISSNIAEGVLRTDFARFVEIATGSLFEVVSQAKVSLNQQFLSKSEYEEIANAAEKECRMFSGLRRSLAQH